MGVADDEAKHFGWLTAALEREGFAYGDLPAHAGLLELASNTKSNLLARLAVVPLVQEARGLDAGPRLVQKLRSTRAFQSSVIVQQIVKEEENHVRVRPRFHVRILKLPPTRPPLSLWML